MSLAAEHAMFLLANTELLKPFSDNNDNSVVSHTHHYVSAALFLQVLFIATLE